MYQHGHTWKPLALQTACTCRSTCRPHSIQLYNAPRLKPNLQRFLFLTGTKLIKILPRKTCGSSPPWCTYRLENKDKRRGHVLAKLTISLPLPKFQAFTKDKIYPYRWGRTVHYIAGHRVYLSTELFIMRPPLKSQLLILPVPVV